jgi:hypothetical protein
MMIMLLGMLMLGTAAAWTGFCLGVHYGSRLGCHWRDDR